uniref:low density lipoprotein receptor adapter protein 1-B-like n=1 Tax=Epinephelus lanceolatus TaxID=310571 RepID=UPI00144612E6|nr:low density lipoprotein receptor adapter protein 1-B-like [Epinephelus lanceolatus]
MHMYVEAFLERTPTRPSTDTLENLSGEKQQSAAKRPQSLLQPRRCLFSQTEQKAESSYSRESTLLSSGRKSKIRCTATAAGDVSPALQAQAVALTVAQAFTVAFELWQVAKEEKGKRVKSGSAGEASSSSHSERSNSLGSLKGTEDVATDNLLDFEDSVNVVVETNGNIEEDQLDNHRPSETNNNPAWEIEDGLDEAFSR